MFEEGSILPEIFAVATLFAVAAVLILAFYGWS
jgi:hypothetical protein